MQLKIFGRCTLRYICRSKVARSSDLKGSHEYIYRNSHILPISTNELLYANNIYIEDFSGKYKYLQLYEHSERLSRQISNICGSTSSSTVAFFNSIDILTVLILWAIWISGQKALGLNSDMSPHQYRDLVNRRKVSLIISSDLKERCSKNLAFENNIALIHLDHKFLNSNFKAKVVNTTQNNKLSETVFLNEVYNKLGAIIFNSRKNTCKTTLLTCKELCAKIKSTAESWTMSKNDRILYVCPSFYRYNDEYIFNLLVSISVGCQVHIFALFDNNSVWRTILGINIPPKERVNTLVAEPKVYQQLILEYEKMIAGDKKVVEYIKDYCVHNIRFMMSCFYPPDPITSYTWLKITGHRLQDGQSIENLDSIVDKSTNIRCRIVNAKNNLLLEINEKQTGKFQTLSTTVIGRFMRANHDEIFYSTGEIVSYCNGVLKIIGRYECISN